MPLAHRAATLLVVLLGVAACNQEPLPTPATQSSALTLCLEDPLKENALAPAGMSGENQAIVPIGRKVSPVGTLASVPYFPIGLALSPDGKLAYVTHSGRAQMEIVETATGTVLDTVKDVGGFRGVVAHPNGYQVFVAGVSTAQVSRVNVRSGQGDVDLQVKLQGAPTAMVLTADGQRLIVVSASNSTVWELSARSLATIRQYKTKGVYPYAIALTPDEQFLLATHVGSDTVTIVRRETGEIVHHLPAGLNPMGIAVDPGRNLAYVVNSDSDTLTVVSLDKMAVADTVSLKELQGGFSGGSPNEIVFSAAQDLLYITFGDLNRVELFSAQDFTRVGAIPTAHYPTGIALEAQAGILGVVSSKGWGGATKLHGENCLVSFINVPIAQEQLSQWTQTADENVSRTMDVWSPDCPEKIPLPLDQDEEQVVEHVVLIVRENKTYDAVLGDFERGNGDPALVVFGEDYTPNLHQLAQQFTNLDNYYADSEESLQGHTWTTQGDCNDFMEKLYPKDPAQVALFGMDPSTIATEKTIFDHCFEHGVSFRNYGEFEGFSKNLFSEYKDFINHKFPYYNLGIKDVWKAEEFIRELELGIFTQFVYIALPNDHTSGAKPGFPTPQSMVADNDEATGMVVDAISNSPYWDSTAIFIIEDDPQGYGGDHVHSHRSVCVAISPWVRREYTSSVHYSIPALYRTMEMLLRLPPIRQNDAFAPPIYDIFVSGTDEEPPEYQPYLHIPRLIPEEFNKQGDYMAQESMALDFSRPDAAPGLGYILWRIMNRDREPPPYARWRDR